MTKFFLSILFFTLPFIHGKIFSTLWVDFFIQTSGNFEFTKVIYFNIFSGIIFLSFFIENFLKNIISPQKIQIISFHKTDKIVWIIFLILFLSTLFSISPFISLIWDTEKWHSFLMFFNLFWLFFILRSLDKKSLKTLLFISLVAGVLASILAIKELFFARYNYWELSRRALGSFGHPNYLAGYLLLTLPFLFPLIKNKKTSLKILGLSWIAMSVLWILFSKSIVAIFLTFFFFIYTYLWTKIYIKKKIWIALWVWCISIVILIFFFPEKLHSFLSRFYLWETTLKILFSNIKIFFLGGWAETLPYFFNSFKSPELYIFENYGYTADRPHNFSLNIFYHFGVFAFWIFLYLTYVFLKRFQKNPKDIGILLFLLFWIFHYFSIASYILIVLIITLYLYDSYPLKVRMYPRQWRIKAWNSIFFLWFTLLSLLWSYYSFKLYESEILFSQKKYSQAQENFSHPKYLIALDRYKEAEKLEWILSQRNIREQIILWPKRDILCQKLTELYPSVENYFYCGSILEEFWNTKISKKYYTQGINKLPNLWDKSSPYWDNYFIKYTITGNRFFSPKFWNIHSILERVKK